MNEGNEGEGGQQPRRRSRIGRRLRCGLIAVLGVVLLLAGMAWWNMMRMPGESCQKELPPAEDPMAALAKELRGDIEHLAGTIGERNVSNRPQALAQAADWIEAELRRVGYQPRRQDYQVSGVPCCNLDVEIRGAIQPQEIVIVGAHYDSALGTAGANDNGSGVAAMLALARRFSKGGLERTLRFVAFVNEEPPYFQTDKMGSRVYARRCRQRDEKIMAMLSLETIGYYDDRKGSQKYPPPFGLLYPSEGNFIGFIGNTASGDLVRQVAETFRKKEAFPAESGAFPAVIPGVGYSDQWSFWQEGYPGVMVTDTAMFRYPYYHTAQDTADKIDFDRMTRVVRGLEQVVSVLACPTKEATPGRP